MQIVIIISIHALLAESDCIINIINNIIDDFYPRSPCGERPHGCYSLRYPAQFLSTLSLRRATKRNQGKRGQIQISIHALLAESDHAPSRRPCPRSNFYPRSPCGERPFIDSNSNFTQKFLSTLSLRRATLEIGENLMDRKHFYPRSPCGERQVGQNRLRQKLAISIHALLAESDLCRAVSFSV